MDLNKLESSLTNFNKELEDLSSGAGDATVKRLAEIQSAVQKQMTDVQQMQGVRTTSASPSPDEQVRFQRLAEKFKNLQDRVGRLYTRANTVNKEASDLADALMTLDPKSDEDRAEAKKKLLALQGKIHSPEITTSLALSRSALRWEETVHGAKPKAALEGPLLAQKKLHKEAHKISTDILKALASPIKGTDPELIHADEEQRIILAQAWRFMEHGMQLIPWKTLSAPETEVACERMMHVFQKIKKWINPTGHVSTNDIFEELQKLLRDPTLPLSSKEKRWMDRWIADTKSALKPVLSPQGLTEGWKPTEDPMAFWENVTKTRTAKIQLLDSLLLQMSPALNYAQRDALNAIANQLETLKQLADSHKSNAMVWQTFDPFYVQMSNVIAAFWASNDPVQQMDLATTLFRQLDKIMAEARKAQNANAAVEQDVEQSLDLCLTRLEPGQPLYVVYSDFCIEVVNNIHELRETNSSLQARMVMLAAIDTELAEAEKLCSDEILKGTADKTTYESALATIKDIRGSIAVRQQKSDLLDEFRKPLSVLSTPQVISKVQAARKQPSHPFALTGPQYAAIQQDIVELMKSQNRESSEAHLDKGLKILTEILNRQDIPTGLRKFLEDAEIEISEYFLLNVRDKAYIASYQQRIDEDHSKAAEALDRELAALPEVTPALVSPIETNVQKLYQREIEKVVRFLEGASVSPKSATSGRQSPSTPVSPPTPVSP